MAGEPIKPKSAGDVCVGAKAESRSGSVAGARSRRRPKTSPPSSPRRARCRRTAAGAKGRLVFALDATMSRQPTWDMACALQADMFREAASLGSLDIRLVYYRGFNECRATGWISDTRAARQD